ncbi:MAG: F0F1 ATP synthase subunit B [Clostridia bacterium]|nr:F0F1 ATP synthase subunit B [Clostridia bacterium]
MYMLNSCVFLLEAEIAEESSLFSPDQFGGYASTAVFTIINVLIFFICYKLFVHKKLVSVIEGRQKIITDSMNNAKKYEEETKINLDKSNADLEEAKEKANTIIEDSKVDAQKNADFIIQKANEEASEIIARAEEEAKRMKKVALEEMKDEISDLAVEITEKVIGDVVSEQTLKEISDRHTANMLKAEVNKLE